MFMGTKVSRAGSMLLNYHTAIEVGIIDPVFTWLVTQWVA